VAILLVFVLLWLIVCYLRVWLSCCVIRYNQLLLDLVGLGCRCVCLLFVVLCWVDVLLHCIYKRYECILLFVVPSLVPCGFLGCSVYFGVFRCSCFAVAFGGLSCVLGLGLMVVLCLWWVGWLGGVGCLFVRLGIWCPAAGCLSVNW